jgi:transposase
VPSAGSVIPGQAPAATGPARRWPEQNAPRKVSGRIGTAGRSRACDLPNFHSFACGLELDALAVTAALILPFHNGRTGGVNTSTKMIKRQMYGRAGFDLLRHRILLG